MFICSYNKKNRKIISQMNFIKKTFSFKKALPKMKRHFTEEEKKFKVFLTRN